MTREDGKFELTVRISKDNYNVIKIFCLMQNISIDEFIDNVFAESREPIEQLIQLSERVNDGSLTIGELDEYTTKFEGITKVFDSLKMK